VPLGEQESDERAAERLFLENRRLQKRGVGLPRQAGEVKDVVGLGQLRAERCAMGARTHVLAPAPARVAFKLSVVGAKATVGPEAGCMVTPCGVRRVLLY
jgi:hypothetical protein